MASDFLSEIKLELYCQWEREWRNVVTNSLREIKDTICMWRTSVHASHRKEVVMITYGNGHSVINHGFLREHGNLSQCVLC